MRVAPSEVLQPSGCLWIKTDRGWKLQQLDDAPIDTGYTPTCSRLAPRPNLSNTSKDVSFARNVIVTGSKAQRKVSVSLSEFLKHMDVEGAVTDIRRKQYLYDLMRLFMKGNLPKMSGTAHREMFKILEMMCNAALDTEFLVHEIRALLACTLEVLTDASQGWIGARANRNKHIQLVENLIRKVNQHEYFEREDDGQLLLTDLPKECLREIMFRMNDHRDILRLSQTCSDLHELSRDNLMWERRTQQHFSEKQMMTFVNDTSYIDDTLPWQQMYRKCYKKFGVKKTYADGLVICSGCKTLHWMQVGHACWSSDDNTEPVYLDPVSPDELILMLNL